MDLHATWQWSIWIEEILFVHVHVQLQDEKRSEIKNIFTCTVFHHIHMPGHFFYRIRTAKCKLRVYNFYTTSFVCINWIFYHHQSLFSLSDFFYHYFVSSSLRSCIIVGRDFSKATSHFLLLLFVCSCIVVHTGKIRTKKC